MPPSKNSANARVFLIHGEDELSVSSKAREIIRKTIPPEEESLGLEMIQARADSVAEALALVKQCREAVQTVGFLGGRKVVWLRNADFLDQSVIGKSKEVRARLKDLADIIPSGFPAGHILVITAAAADARSELYRACAAAGEVIAFELGKAWQRDKTAVPFAAGLLRKLGLTANAEVIGALVQKVGADSRQLQQEVEKLFTYLGEQRTVRLEDIEAVVSPAREVFAWDLEDAVGDRNLARSLRILRRLLFQKEEPIRLITGLEHRFRSLLIFREALELGWLKITGRGLQKGAITPEQDQLFYQTLNDNRLKNPYVAEMRAKQAAAFTQKDLDQSRQFILETRRQLVSSTIPDTWLMEMLIINICRKKRR